jgi:hypothetical protein
MRFFDYLEAVYMQKNLANQTPPYSAWVNAQVKAVHAIINLQRVVLTAFAWPLVFVNYFAVVAGVVEAPRSAKDQLEAYQKKALETQNKSAAESRLNGKSQPPAKAAQASVPNPVQ